MTTEPASLAHIFHGLGLRPVKLSKYCLAVALLTANPWRRTIRRDFAESAR